MAWKINFNSIARKELLKLDPHSQKIIINYLTENILTCLHPKTLGKALTGDLKKLWRYRVGKFRIICEINDAEFTILLLKIDKRAEIYR